MPIYQYISRILKKHLKKGYFIKNDICYIEIQDLAVTPKIHILAILTSTQINFTLDNNKIIIPEWFTVRENFVQIT